MLEMFEHAAKLNFEGIVSKNAQAPYRSDPNEGWLKIKTVQKGQFPVIGFVKDPTDVAALYLRKREGKDLVYMGKVGTGWSRTVSSQIRKQACSDASVERSVFCGDLQGDVR
jgi:bifunctional non-homologous end joining protein LigD